MTAALLAGALLLSLPLANADLQKCQMLETEFDYQGMIAACSIAAADPNVSADERILTSRLLGIAHAAIGDDDEARTWFIRLLSLDPEHELPKEISPRFRGAFAKAMEEFARDGTVTVSHTPPTQEAALAGGPLNVRFEVSDKLSRVARAVLEVEAVFDGSTAAPQQSPLTRSVDEASGQAIFEGALADPGTIDDDVPAGYTLRYRIVLQNLVGAEVVADPVSEPVSLPRTKAESGGGATAEGGAGNAILWASVAAVGGIVAVTAVAGGVTAALCVSIGCGETDTPAPTGYVRIEVEAPAEVRP